MGYWQTGCPRDVDIALVRIGAVNAPGYAATAAHVRGCATCRLRATNGAVQSRAVAAAGHAGPARSKVGLGIALGCLAILIALLLALT